MGIAMSTTKLEALLEEIDTPELRDICDEDAFITRMRNIYHRVRRNLDFDVPLTTLLERAIEVQVGMLPTAERNPQ